MLDDFAVFILSHGRADKVDTLKTLKRCGYTGRVYIVIDNEDEQAEKYYQNFGRDMVIMFDKAAEAERTDCGDNFEKRNTVLFARNAVFDIAEGMGIEYFLVLDDDYNDFRYKINHRLLYIDRRYIKDGDLVISLLLDYYKSINCASLAIAQGGDFIGGAGNDIHVSLNKRRKAMNFWILSTKRRFEYVSRMNDDVSTYTVLGNRGLLFLTFPLIAIQQHETQSNEGGLSEMYKAFGTYIKSFYTVMYAPSCTKVEMMQSHTHNRLHHAISWDNAVPAIISEQFKKK